ncbi:unnamed protein product [Bursaphelenchus okinawaensis]|uniref:F-box domain-containing protein n=1 Tax=Bursaphelenchus okinawaensis TaxID=465554 RepID=A0A811LRF5_9BILA|nr:unnamed protein product [Bursaphelenchus okinawaensis]CAG9127851.1 unnamed protein product [Bursaphelenchus okinawaensis]
MRGFAKLLPLEMWHCVIEYLEIMEDAISLAMVNKHFYKLVGMDFKKICYDHVIYRLKGETWAEAFNDFGARSVKMLFVESYVHHEHAVCCPFTGKMAIKLDNGYVILTNIDFGLKEFTILDFTSYTNHITHVNMINRGKELLVRTSTFVLVYDLCSMKVTQKHDMVPTSRYGQNGQLLNYQIIKNGFIFDLYTKKEFKIDAQTAKGLICYINMYDRPKYIAVHTTDNKLVLIDSETDERQDVCEWKAGMNVYVINENDSVFVMNGYVNPAEEFGLRIYSIKKRKMVFEEPEVRYWRLFNSNTLFQTQQKTFLVYNKLHDCWLKTKRDTNLLLFYNIDYFCDFGFVPLPTYKIVESQRYRKYDEVVRNMYFWFKKDKIITKRFSAEVELHDVLDWKMNTDQKRHLIESTKRAESAQDYIAAIGFMRRMAMENLITTQDDIAMFLRAYRLHWEGLEETNGPLNAQTSKLYQDGVVLIKRYIKPNISDNTLMEMLHVLEKALNLFLEKSN